LQPGLTVALVHRSSITQRLLSSVAVEGELDPDDPTTDDGKVLHDLAQDLCRGLELSWSVEHSFVTVISRPGRCVFGVTALAVLGAWRYANHIQPVFQGELVLVTPSGWRTSEQTKAGRLPCCGPEQLERVVERAGQVRSDPDGAPPGAPRARTVPTAVAPAHPGRSVLWTTSSAGPTGAACSHAAISDPPSHAISLAQAGGPSVPGDRPAAHLPAAAPPGDAPARFGARAVRAMGPSARGAGPVEHALPDGVRPRGAQRDSGSLARWDPADAEWLTTQLEGHEDRFVADRVAAHLVLFACYLAGAGRWTGSAEALVRCLHLLDPQDEDQLEEDG